MNENRHGAPPPDSLPERRIECPVLFLALEFIGIVVVAAGLWLAWIIL